LLGPALRVNPVTPPHGGLHEDLQPGIKRRAKVDDADENLIEITAVAAWQVADTASPSYSVDDNAQFVTIPTETAVRHIASSDP
jgi:regulator of protease activity HflC (stomatin/prohibitin superfamily)